VAPALAIYNASAILHRPDKLEDSLAGRPRILVFAGGAPGGGDAFALPPGWDVVRTTSLQEGLTLLRSFGPFDGIFVPAVDTRVWARAKSLLQHESVLEVLGEGVAAVSPDMRVQWANATFEKWCGGPIVGKVIHEALGSTTFRGPDPAPFSTALSGIASSARLTLPGDRYLDLRVTPLIDESGQVHQLIVLCRDITAEVQQQQKLDALHQAGRELASLHADQVEEVSAEERVEVLKHNIRRLTHDLLHYDVIEIRLLDPKTGELRPLLAEGMTPDAASRVLFARPEGNGVTGYVAATGKSYVCADAACDPHYIEGSRGARSSLTVALSWGEKVIGTFNVESPQLGAFGPQDLQFAEIFCRELASALHTLDLLLLEKRQAASQSIEAINREVGLPVDDILTAATSILERWIGHEPEMAEKLRKIIASARVIKQSIQKVGEGIAPAASPLAFAGADSPSRLNLRVLVVDNDERVRRSAHSVLGRLGCIVETARDGREALTMAKLSTYDAMLADIRLPDQGGYDVYRALRQAQPAANVILMTGFGYDATHSLVKARQDGLKHVLYKPFRVDQLLQALQDRQAAG
jgi:CheY-like chemotaxis protein/PAS domain-containing protein